MSDEKHKLIAPYMDYLRLSSEVSEDELPAIFDRLYDKPKEKLKIYYTIYSKKLKDIKSAEES